MNENRDQMMAAIIQMLNSHPFTFEFQVKEKPEGIKVIWEVSQKEMDNAIKESRQKTNEKDERKPDSMRTCVYVNRMSGMLVPEGYPNSVAYFSEDAVRDWLRKEYEQANRIANSLNDPFEFNDETDLINVEKSVEQAIKKLKGGEE